MISCDVRWNKNMTSMKRKADSECQKSNIPKINHHYQCFICTEMHDTCNELNEKNNITKNKSGRQVNNVKMKNMAIFTSSKPCGWVWTSIQRLLVSYLVLNFVCNIVSSGVNGELVVNNNDESGHFTPEWAAHIPGGDLVAQQVANEHGYIVLGKIFDDHYHMYHNSVSKRSISPSQHHQSCLDDDERVRWSQQQRAKTRTKRDYVKPSRQSKTFKLNDQKWPIMWYLNRGNGLDMNVIPAWKEGITGKGVVVTILDDGLESDHPDLIANYDPKASYDVNSHDDDPSPHYDMTDSNRHGTRCAGEVAATANNSECAVGIAFGARVGGVRMLDGDVTDAVEARSLSLNPQHIDIYSASWGPDDDGKTVDGPGEMATRAFVEGVTKGRGGKGSIFIWASGNGGREHDNCNCDGYTNSIWTLSISSATEEGLVPWYSEMCSSTLATTYSSGGQGEKQVVTTDLHHSCTASHTGTSASAPLAAGIAALVLEANRNLTWRDLQHIVVRTAKPSNLKDPTWSKNGVGRRVSHSFGYGLMDAHAMVKLARTWKTVPEQQRCEINSPHFDKQIPPKTRLKLQLTVKDCKGVNFIEHVQAKITLTSPRRGDIQIYLTSPFGTKVTLLTSRSHDISRAGFSNWPFMSVHTWGEAPHGNWQLEIYNDGRYLGYTFFRAWSIVIYGTELPAQRDDPMPVTKVPPIPALVPTPKSNVTKGGKKVQQQLRPAYNIVNQRKNGKNKNKKNKSLQKAATSLPNYAVVYANNSKKFELDAYSTTTASGTTTRPKVTQNWNGLNGDGGSWGGKQQSQSVIPQKAGIKAPKQVKDNTATATGQTVMARGQNLFDQYDKIQHFYPELQPYLEPSRENNNSYFDNNNNNVINNNRMTNNLTHISTSTTTSMPPSSYNSNTKPSRANSKMIIFPDTDYAKNKKGSTLSSSYVRTQNSRISSNQRNGNAQITQWDLIFYGTEETPQPNDPPRYGIDKPNLESESYDGEIGQNVLEFEPGTAGQWRDVQQIGESHSDRQRTASNDLTGTACRNFSANSKCIACLQTTFLYEGKCYSSCPERSFMVPEVSFIVDATTKMSSSLRERRNDDERLDMLKPGEITPLASPEVPQKICSSCHFSCLRCHGPNDYDCSACAPDALFSRVSDTEAYCYPPASKSNQNDVDGTFILARLNSNELLVVGLSLGGILFIIILGGYFFFRNICGSSDNKNYTYNALMDGDEEQRLRLTYNDDSAVAYRREIDSIINDDSTDISCSEDEDDVLQRVINR